MTGRRPAVHTLLESAEGDDVMATYRTAIDSWEYDPAFDGDVYLYLPLEQIGLLESIAAYSHPDHIAGHAPSPVFARLLQGMRERSDGWLVHAPSSLAFNPVNGDVGVVQSDGGIGPMTFATTSVVEPTPEGPTRITRVPSRDQGPWAVPERPDGIAR